MLYKPCFCREGGGSSAIAQPADEEKKFDDAIQQFGYMSDTTLQCATSNQPQSMEKDALGAFTGITRLFGSDRAFFYTLLMAQE